jgi:hypothetical protein
MVPSQAQSGDSTYAIAACGSAVDDESAVNGGSDQQGTPAALFHPQRPRPPFHGASRLALPLPQKRMDCAIGLLAGSAP